MRFRNYLVLPAFMFLISLLTHSIAAKELITSAAETDYPPFSMVDSEGRATGFSVELMKEVLGKMDYDVTFRTGIWSQVKSLLEKGEIRALPLVGRTPERDKIFDFTFPYMTLHGAIVVRDDNTDINEISDLEGKKIAVMKGDNAEEFLIRTGLDAEIYTTDTFKHALVQLSGGLYNAVVIQKLTALRLIRENRIENLKIIDKPLEGFSQDFCFAVKKGDSRTLSILNEGLSIAIADGTYRQLHSRWFASLELPEDRKIIIGGDSNFPPFEFLDTEGNPSGFNIDIANAIADSLGLDIEIRLGPWHEIIRDFERGNIDALTGMFYSAERDRRFDFTQPHTIVHCVSVIRKGEGAPPVSLKDLHGKTIVVQNGDIMHDYMAENKIDKYLTAVESQEEALRQLSRGFHDTALVTRMGALYLIQKNGWENLEIAREPLLSAEYCLAVPDGRKSLHTQLSEGLKIIDGNGNYREIYARWMGIYDDGGIDYRMFIKFISFIIVPLLLVLAVSFFWTWTLKKQVDLRTGEIRRNEEQLRSLVEGAPDAIFIHTGFILRYLNREACSLFGVSSPEELIGKPITERFHPSTRDFATERVVNIYEKKEYAPPAEQLYLKTDGSALQVEVSAVPFFYMGDNGALVFARDITWRKETEISLLQKQSMLARTESIARIGSWEWDAVSDIVTWSDEAFRTFMRKKEEGAPPFSEHGSFFDQKDFEMLKTAVKETMEHGIPFVLEMRVHSPDGETKRCLSRGYPKKDENGKITGLYGSIQDITEIYLAREKIRHLNNVLKAIRGVNQLIVREKNITTLINEGCRLLTESRGYLSAVMVLVDANCRIQQWAESGLENCREELQTVLGKGLLSECCSCSVEAEGIVSTDSNHTCIICDIHEKNRDRGVMCTKLSHNKSTLGFLSVSLQQGLSADDEEKGLFLEMADDIAYALSAIMMEKERARFERKSETLEGQLIQAQKMESIGRLAGGVAHDYNNMLSVIIGYSELAMDKTSPDNPVYHELEEILSATRRSAEITRQLLAFARKQTINPKKIDLNETIESMLKTLRRLIGEDIDLVWLPAADLKNIIMDSSQIDQILANLCVNSRDAIEGVGTITIATSNQTIDNDFCFTHEGASPGEYVLLTVSDNGYGMDEKTLGLIFEPFYTTKAKGHGTGLGLSTVYGIVKQNNGFIYVESRKGEGSIFSIYLPAAQKSNTGETVKAEKYIPSGRGETVMLVEDEQAILEMGKKMLLKLGYNVLAAETPGKAVEIAYKNREEIRLLITDVVMPEMNGRELSAEIRKIIPAIKTLYISGYTADVIANRGILENGVYFLQKPFSLRDLGLKIREITGNNE